MHWLALGIFTAAGIVGIRWMLRRSDSLGRVRPFPTLWVVLLVILGSLAMTPWFLRVRLESRLGAAASSVVGVPVAVFCQSFGEAFVDIGSEYGYVEFGPDGLPERSTLIKRQQCHDLQTYLRSDKSDPSEGQVVAVHTLTHESVHMSGLTNEAQTECHALQRDAETARLLGATPQQAGRLAAIYWTSLYPRMPGDYRSPECRPGGKLDLHGPDAPW
jgi:hypothetical protein